MSKSIYTIEGKKLIVENANLPKGFRDFAGDRWGKGGKRYFFITIDNPEVAARLIDENWPLKSSKWSTPEEPSWNLKVILDFEYKRPAPIVKQYFKGKKPLEYNEEIIGELNYMDIETADVECVLQHYNGRGTSQDGYHAKCATLFFRLQDSSFLYSKWAEEEFPEEDETTSEYGARDGLPF